MSNQNKTETRKTKRRTLTITDLMTVGVFFVINMVAGVAIAFIGITPITYIMITSIQALILGIPMMLFIAKVNKPGMILIFLALSGISSLLLGLGFWTLLLSLFIAIIAELTLRAGEYKSIINSILAYAFMTVAPTATYIPLFFSTQQYIKNNDMDAKYGSSFTEGLASFGQMSWLFIVIVIATFICGILGGLLGRRIFTKHFERAGIV